MSRAKQGAKRAAPPAPAPATAEYKVVELSHVDESSLEATINEWVGRGWMLDGVQFAMRESSKRPAMAFVLFTRAGGLAEAREERASTKTVARHDRGSDAWARLRALAGEG